MNIIITPSDGSTPFESEVIKIQSGNIQYKIKHSQYLGFQFDDWDRPSNYFKPYAETKSFHGFLIGKHKKQSIE